MRRIAITSGRLGLEQDESGFMRAVRAIRERAAELAQNGVEAVLVREKDLSVARLTEVTRQVVVELDGSGTRVLTAGPHALMAAAAGGAQGVHLGSPGSAAAADRRIQQIKAALPQAWITVACHTVDEAAWTARLGVSAILFAPVFGKQVQGAQGVEGIDAVPGLGLDALRQACEAAGQTPVFALGGVTEDNAEACVAAGAAGVAAIRMFDWAHTF